MANKVEFTPDLLEDAAADVAEILRENDTPQERKAALISFAEGTGMAGVLAAGQAVTALVGGPFDMRVWVGTAVGAFATGCVRYLRDWRTNRKAKK